MHQLLAGALPSNILSSLSHRLYRWLLERSPRITEPDQRRQAVLLSAFVLGVWLLSIPLQSAYLWQTTGPRSLLRAENLLILVGLPLIYVVSRSHHLRLSAYLAVGTVVLVNFIVVSRDPANAVGLLDYLIIPMLLASFFIGIPGLVALGLLVFAGLLALPSLVPGLSRELVLVGPLSFLLTAAVMTLITTIYRDQVELDRRQQLMEKEQRSQREARRAESLLRVAERLNAEFDLDSLLQAISEEARRALDADACIVGLLDERGENVHIAAASGVSAEVLRDLPPAPRAAVEFYVRESSRVAAVPDLAQIPESGFISALRALSLQSAVFAALDYEGALIGTITVGTSGKGREFTEDELLLLRGIADQGALAIIYTRLFKDAQRRLENLQALRAIDVAISTSHDLAVILQVLLEKITGQLHVDAAGFLLLDKASQQLQFAANRGFRGQGLRFTRLRIGEGMAGRAALENQAVYVRDLRDDPRSLRLAPGLAAEDFVSYVAAPLVTEGAVTGVLEVFHRGVLEPNAEWMDFLVALAGQAAIGIQQTSLFEDLERTNMELLQAYDATIEGWSHALDLRDHETEGHTQRVTAITLRLAARFGIQADELRHVRWGALLHDIGKMGVPDRILLKDGPLSPEEWIIVQQHPAYAHETLRGIEFLRPALDIPYCHHEKWDGSGYPRGLSGESIPLAARIFAIVDVWDALTSDRPYRKAWSPEKTLEHIRQGSGSHFDPQVVEAFTALVREDGLPPAAPLH